MTNLAKAISVILHPVFMPFYGTVLLLSINSHLQSEIPEQIVSVLMIWIFVITAVFPILSSLVFLRSGMISSLSMPDKRERIGPYILTIFYYGLAYYMLRKGDLPVALFAMLIGAIVSLVAITFITWFWKISAHMMGIGGLIGGIIAFSEVYELNLGIYVAALILLAGAIATSRLHLESHRPSQLYAGALLGFTALYLCVRMKLFI